MVGSLLAHGVVYLISLLASLLTSHEEEPDSIYVMYFCLVVVSFAGALGAHLVKERPQCYQWLTIAVWCVMQALACYGILFSSGTLERVRGIAVNFILWKTWPTIMCRTSISVPYLLYCFCNDIIVSGIARNWHAEEFDEQFPVRSYVFGACITFAYTCIAVYQNHRMHSLYMALAELAAEKDAFQSLMNMVCDATVWISEDSKTVLRCDKRFDMLMGQPMQGVPLEEVVVNPDEEVARLHRVFAQDSVLAQDTAGGGPVVLLPTTLRTATGPATTDLLIVHNQVAQPADIDQACASGFLVGVRLSHEQAGVPSAPPPTTICDLSMAAKATGNERSDGDAWAIAYSCPSEAGRSAPAVLVTHTCGPHQEARALLCKDGGDCLPATAVAWIDKDPVPRPLHDLSAGERILCYDNVGAKLTYANVLKVAPAARKENTDWVKVTLEDGGVLTMTADHPVAVQSDQAKQQLARTCLHASELRANTDQVLVMRMVPTLVTDVEHFGRVTLGQPEVRRSPEGNASQHDGWMTIEVEQPQRHELLVAACDKYGLPGNMVAVSSCDRTPDPLAQNMCEKNTFVCIDENDGSSSSRAHSAPPSVFRGRTVPLHSPVNEKASVSGYSGTHSEVSAISDSIESREREAHAKILIGYGNGSLQQGGAVNRVSDLIYWQKSGFPTLGSAHAHTGDECRPCSFHYTWQRMPDKRPPCKMSHLCDYCHDDSHHDGWRSKYRKRRRPKDTPSLKICL